MINLIDIQDAVFSYEDVDIFSRLSFNVQKGELLCLMGANGCGKTTLLRCINGILKLKKGKVMLEGKDITAMSPTDVAKKMGFVFQDNIAPFPYPVIDVVCMGRAPHLGMFHTLHC